VFVCPNATISNAPAGPTKPDAGVIVPKPATIPVTVPNAVGLPNLIVNYNFPFKIGGFLGS
jgi:hypothetical protein